MCAWNIKLNTIRQAFLVVSCAIILSSCTPRGETKSLDEVLSSERAHYSQVFSKIDMQALKPEVSQALRDMNTALEKLSSQASPQEIAESTKRMEALLTSLVEKAGYPSRPAIGEIMSQYRVMAANQNPSMPAVKLLAARTYTLLAAELEGVKFAL